MLKSFSCGLEVYRRYKTVCEPAEKSGVQGVSSVIGILVVRKVGRGSPDRKLNNSLFSFAVLLWRL